MPDQKLQFRDLKVPVAILVFAGLACVSAAAGLGYTPYAKTPPEQTLALVAAILSGACAIVLALGYFAARAGYTKPELDKWGDEAMSGKPPI
jgi:hypothetical protein